ncbi:MAG: AAA family ATPase [Anaerolineae bacterium]|nr:AAA family ATPase [Anaerolineae bacterium]
MTILSDNLSLIPAQNEIASPFIRLRDLPLVILVGLTGVGKSTVTDHLREQVHFTLLPNRRQVTDEVIIAVLQKEAGQPVQTVTDRLQRLEYTARYRNKYPGGMAHALSRLAVDLNKLPPPIFFDGLRGVDEVRYAVHYFPQARFIVLDASDSVRLSRLLNRGDDFDQVKLDPVAGQNTLSALQTIPQIDTVFTAADLQKISQTTAHLPVDEVLKKTAIIIKERQNYDSQTARDYLTHQLSPDRVLVVDTAQITPDRIAKYIKQWLVADLL